MQFAIRGLPAEERILLFALSINSTSQLKLLQQRSVVSCLQSLMQASQPPLLFSEQAAHLHEVYSVLSNGLGKGTAHSRFDTIATSRFVWICTILSAWTWPSAKHEAWSTSFALKRRVYGVKSALTRLAGQLDSLVMMIDLTALAFDSPRP